MGREKYTEEVVSSSHLSILDISCRASWRSASFAAWGSSTWIFILACTTSVERWKQEEGKLFLMSSNPYCALYMSFSGGGGTSSGKLTTEEKSWSEWIIGAAAGKVQGSRAQRWSTEKSFSWHQKAVAGFRSRRGSPLGLGWKRWTRQGRWQACLPSRNLKGNPVLRWWSWRTWTSRGVMSWSRWKGKSCVHHQWRILSMNPCRAESTRATRATRTTIMHWAWDRTLVLMNIAVGGHMQKFWDRCLSTIWWNRLSTMIGLDLALKRLAWIQVPTPTHHHVLPEANNDMLQALVLDLDRINALAEQIIDDIILRAVQLIPFSA